MAKRFLRPNFSIFAIALSLVATSCNSGDPQVGEVEADVTIEEAIESGSLPFYNSQDFSPKWIKPGSKELDSFHTIPDFEFTNQNGNSVSTKNLNGKIYVASFFFTSCPGICSPVNLNLLMVQERFLDDDEVRILSYTITPDTDTVSVLRAYAEKREIDSKRWDLVTGDKDAIFKLAKQGYFAHEDMGKSDRPGDLQHTENVLLVDSNRHIRGVYNGLSSAAMLDLIADIEALKEELSS